jgi:hypothetical protein
MSLWFHTWRYVMDAICAVSCHQKGTDARTAHCLPWTWSPPITSSPMCRTRLFSVSLQAVMLGHRSSYPKTPNFIILLNCSAWTLSSPSVIWCLYAQTFCSHAHDAPLKFVTHHPNFACTCSLDLAFAIIFNINVCPAAPMQGNV